MRYLTKSRYKLGLECPNKLYYTNKPEEYANIKTENPFLEALASGGFQVEELARLHYPDGILIDDKNSSSSYNYQEKVNETNLLLQRENVVIFEAAFQFENLFIRVDILKKNGNSINLIEVKAKSFNGSIGLNNFLGNTSKIKKDWKAYLFDIAFQKYVIENAQPKFKVTPFLMLVDKDKKTSINGLNQIFRIDKKAGNRTGITILEKGIKELDVAKDSVLTQINVSSLIDSIYSGEERLINELDFRSSINLLSEKYTKDIFFDYDLKLQQCKKCEFKRDPNKPNLKSGFEECFKKKMNWIDSDFSSPNIFEIWDFRSWSKLEKTQKIKLEDISDSEFGEDENKKEDSISRVKRQLIQKEKSLNRDNTHFLLKEPLLNTLKSWKFPLNFIDFEASTVPLPFHSNQNPYQKIAFQFSHHILHENGFIEHANEFINVQAGVFPNFEFIRTLKKALEQNQGSIFQYSSYENSTLNQLKVQLEESTEVDKQILIDFIQSIAKPTDGTEIKWVPTRGMIDLCEIIKLYYYNPYTKGSNSIKDVLPAILKSSPLIIEKFSKANGDVNITSKNFKPNHIWLKYDNLGELIDPYKSLEKPFAEWDEKFDRISTIEDVNNGGAALTAYGLTQYTDMEEQEREKIKSALLKYCELDTLAMVIVYEHLKEICED